MRREVGPLEATVLILLVMAAVVASADFHVGAGREELQSGSQANMDATAMAPGVGPAPDAITFSPSPNNPVFTPDSGGWDSVAVIPYSVLRTGGSWTMWYTGTNATAGGIGRATSPDGVHWTRDPAYPILNEASWPNVLYESGSYKMWFQSTSGYYQPTEVEYATSADGIHWTPYAANPVLSPSVSGFDSLIVTPGGVVHDATGYRMWYTGNDGGLGYSVGLATSADGVSWTKYGSNPIITPGFGGSYDSERVITCNVLPWNGGLLMGYVGADTNFVQRIALATSTDGVHWKPVPGPTLDLGPSGSWDDLGLSRMAIADTGTSLLMWYGGSSIAGYWETGLATAPSSGSAPLEFGGLGILGFVLLLALVVAAAAAFLIILVLAHRPRPGWGAPVQTQPTPTCARCGSLVPPGNSYCGKCGAAVGPPGWPDPPKP